jgi:hypothetical protein
MMAITMSNSMSENASRLKDGALMNHLLRLSPSQQRDIAYRDPVQHRQNSTTSKAPYASLSPRRAHHNRERESWRPKRHVEYGEFVRSVLPSFLQRKKRVRKENECQRSFETTEFGGDAGDDDLAAPVERNGVRRAKCLDRQLAAAAIDRFEGARLVINARRMTPELRPDWCVAIRGSFSKTIGLQPGCC